MAKSRPSRPTKGRRKSPKTVLNSTQVPRPKNREQRTALSATTLLAQATNFLQQGHPDGALPLVQRALEITQSQSLPPEALLPALTLLGETYLELGDTLSAATTFLQAVKIDPDGAVTEDQGGGPEKFLWLAQLCEGGGEESIEWFQRAVNLLEREVANLEISVRDGVKQLETLNERKKKLAAAFCGMVEVWMTDLSLFPEAESTCTSLITRALAVNPNAPTLQTHASLLISQCDLPKARESLSRSLALWQDLPSDHPDVPDFATQISLARLLMEAEMESQAMKILEGLVNSDDGSVEAWYLGGWCALLMSSIATETDGKIRYDTRTITEEQKLLLITSREWLNHSLQLYTMQEYEDKRLRDHATELVQNLDEKLGTSGTEQEDGGGGDWEDDESLDNVDSDGSESDTDNAQHNHATAESKDEEMYDNS